MLVRVQNDIASVMPIAGTRKRGKSPEDDTRLGEELLSDQKELAEHVMLVDLGRNDIGRVSEFGSVRSFDVQTPETIFTCNASLFLKFRENSRRIQPAWTH